jgi:RNA polymerase sigma factor (sigma-70 family)
LDIATLRRQLRGAPEFRARLDDAFETLRPRERRIVEMRLGIERYVDALTEPKTLKQVAARWNKTPEWARQIQGTALKKLAHPSRGLIPQAPN